MILLSIIARHSAQSVKGSSSIKFEKRMRHIREKNVLDTFTIGIRGSYVERRWMAALTALGVSEAGAAHFMEALALQCLTELNEVYSTQAAALRSKWMRDFMTRTGIAGSGRLTQPACPRIRNSPPLTPHTELFSCVIVLTAATPVLATESDQHLDLAC